MIRAVLLAGAALAAAAPSLADTLHIETIAVGSAHLSGSQGPGIVVAPEHFARRERLSGTPPRERFVVAAQAQAQQSYDALRPGAVFIAGRLVYLARQGKKEFIVDGGTQTELKGPPVSPAGAGRIWSARDRQSYAAFASEGTRIRHYAGNQPMGTAIDTLPLVSIDGPDAGVWFAARRKGVVRLVGQAASADVVWSRLDRVLASRDGGVAFAYGLQGQTPVLMRNSALAYTGALSDLQITADGAHWLASRSQGPQAGAGTDLLVDKVVVGSTDKDLGRQRPVLAANSPRWRWLLFGDDDRNVRLRAAGQPERVVPGRLLELRLSPDGADDYVLRTTTGEPLGVVLERNGVETLARSADAQAGSLSVRDGQGWAFIAVDGGRRRVVSDGGVGPEFDEIGALLWQADGQIAYAGFDAKTGWHIGVGASSQRVDAADVHHLGGQTLACGRYQVLATKGDAVFKLRVADPGGATCP